MRKRTVMIALAVAAVAAGVIVAVSSSGGNGHAARALARRETARADARTEAQAAAGYLGLTRSQLLKQLQSGHTLAQIADAAGGRKSAKGLVEALLSTRASQLGAAVNAKKLSPASERRRLAKVGRRLEAELERTPGYTGLPATARYLGVSTAQLRADLRAGRSLAQIAASTPGKSAAGLIDTRVSTREASLRAALASGKISRATESLLASSLRQRITREVERKPTR